MSAPKTKMIQLADIVVPPDRMRQLRPEKVNEIAESIAARGQLQAIIVQPQDSGYVLAAGRHRLEARRQLGHAEIECRVLDGLSADEALIVEIDENLARADLTPSERAAHHAKRKALYLKLHPETKHGGAPGKAGGGKKAKDAKLASFVNDTAKKAERQNAPSPVMSPVARRSTPKRSPISLALVSTTAPSWTRWRSFRRRSSAASPRPPRGARRSAPSPRTAPATPKIIPRRATELRRSNWGR